MRAATTKALSPRAARDVNERNLGYFEQEVQKLDAWADDLKLGLEQEIKEIDREIKEVRRTAATSPTLEEKLSWQKKQRELEGKRSKLRRELFARQDEVEAQRNDLISQLEVQLQQQVEERTLLLKRALRRAHGWRVVLPLVQPYQAAVISRRLAWDVPEQLSLRAEHMRPAALESRPR